ncbi:hypothetical protein VTL71DRAFT_8514 [Oculimacula yallundae]|uniref:Uncharacterized protein n=1 Tax=Oculimacula yallundae TaxID=86028 RepID=A0ABR4CXX5_9HELO
MSSEAEVKECPECGVNPCNCNSTVWFDQ